MKRTILLGLCLATVLAISATAFAVPTDTGRDASINAEWKFQQDITTEKDLNVKGAVKAPYWNGTDFIYETLVEPYPVYFYEEFIGANSTFPAMPGTTLTSKFNFVRNSTGDGTVAMVASTPPGLAQLAINASSGVQSAALLWADNLALDISKGIFFETRVAFTNLPDYSGSASFGLMGNNTSPDPMANGWFAMFDVGGSAINNSAINATTNDGVIHTNSSTGVTASADYRVYRIETDTNKQVRYFVDGVQVAASEAPTWSTASGRLLVQPYFNVSQPSVATTALGSNGTIRIDYLRCGQKSR